MENFLDLIAEFTYTPWNRNLGELGLNQPSYWEAIEESTLAQPEQKTLKVKFLLPFTWIDIEGQPNLKAELTNFLQAKYPEHQVDVNLEYKISARQRTKSQTAVDVPGVKNIIAVSSAKGGVGKSSVAVNLAYALANAGLKVGILDADIYGPSIPHLLGESESQPTSDDNKSMNPVRARNLVANSIGFLIPESDPAIWRGPVASQMLTQLLVETNWGDLDYLLIDMPPGTGDIQLTVAQNLGPTGAVIVSTPQEIALADVVKGYSMFTQLEIPIAGIIENMRMFTCPNCGYEAHLFGEDGVYEVADLLQASLIGSLPLDPRVGKDGDAGFPTVAKEPDGKLAAKFKEIANLMSLNLFLNTKAAAPKINLKIKQLD